MRKLFFVPLLLLLSCSQEKAELGKSEDQGETKEKKLTRFKNFEERVRHEICEKLSIPSDENFDIQVYYENLNPDEKKDAVITVNRLHFAMDMAAKSNNPAKRAEIGYMGNFNHFFFYDGMKDEISVPVTVASSAKAPLQVYFENIQSDAFKDIIIEYRINRAAFRSYYQLQQNDLHLVFQWKTFDNLGLPDFQASTFSYEEGTFCLVKDIVIHKGMAKNYPASIPDLYNFELKIIPTEQLEYRFMFDPAKQKYVTNAKPKNEL